MSPVRTCFYLTFLAAVFIQGRDGINDRPKRPEIGKLQGKLVSLSSFSYALN